MFERSTNMPFSELKTWLSDFSTLVADRVLEKMPYNMWRHLNQPRANTSLVFLDWNKEEAELYFTGDPTVHHLMRSDNSFGEFILENYLDNNDYWSVTKNKLLVLNDLSTVKSTAARCGSELRLAASTAMSAICPTMHFESNSTLDTKVDKAEFDATMSEFKNYINERIDAKNKKENENMNTFKFDFGPVNGNAVRMSMYGLAVKNKAGTWVSYDAGAGDIMDVDVLNFDGSKFLYKMPVAMKDITVGDVVIHHGAPMFVVGKSNDEKGLVVIDVIAGERKEVMLAKSPFGFNFATKVVNFLGGAFNAVNADNPFGNMWMLMAMSGDNEDMSDMLPFMMMANGGSIDPNMMMFMAMSGQGNNNMLPFLMMANSMKTTAPAHNCTCTCGQHNQ